MAEVIASDAMESALNGAAEYVAANGSRLHNEEAKLLGAEFESLRQREGAITPESVVREAAPEESPLHGFFEWDDSRAAHEHRLSQAAYLIRSVKVMISSSQNDEPTAVRAFVRVASETKGRYLPIEQVLNDDDMRKELVGKALAELEDWRLRYKALSELAGVFKAIERVSKKHG